MLTVHKDNGSHSPWLSAPPVRLVGNMHCRPSFVCFLDVNGVRDTIHEVNTARVRSGDG